MTMDEIAALYGHPPYCRYLVYSDPFGGKSTFAATFPKPMVVCAFDPYLKDSPYLAKGYYDEPMLDGSGTPYRDVVDANGVLLIRIYYFHDEEPERPSAFRRFQRFMHEFTAAERTQWETVVVDSTSALRRACLYEQQFVLNRDSKEPRQWYAGATDYIERLLDRFGSMQDINVVLLAHISRKTDEAAGTIRRLVNLPGRMGMNGPDTVPEIYRMFNDRTTGVPMLQTKRGADSYLAGSQFLQAPNPCEPRFSALWQNFVPRTRPRPQATTNGAVPITAGAAVDADVATDSGADTTEPAGEHMTNE